jgi:hypothetical protein
MTITRPPAPVPTKLPIARLYLDDVEDIVQILLDAEKKLGLEPLHYIPDDVVRIRFIVGKGAKRRNCDTVADLSGITPKSTNDFELHVSRPLRYNAILLISRSMNQITTSDVSYDEQVAVFHRVEHIFRQRRLFWRNVASDLPAWAWAVSFFLFALVIDSAAALLSKWAAVGVVIAGTILGAAIVMAARVSGSTVMFRNFSEHDEVQQEKTQKFLFEAVRLVGAFLFGMLTLYLKHKYWP